MSTLDWKTQYGCWIGRYHLSIRLLLLEEYPPNKPWFINPGLTLPTRRHGTTPQASQAIVDGPSSQSFTRQKLRKTENVHLEARHQLSKTGSKTRIHETDMKFHVFPSSFWSWSDGFAEPGRPTSGVPGAHHLQGLLPGLSKTTLSSGWSQGIEVELPRNHKHGMMLVL
jgi:hypothetical protein